jgi:hypothetical protein
MRLPILLLLIIASLPLAHAHMPPKSQALVIVKEADGYKFEFLIFPKKPQAGTISELVLNTTYLKDGQPYTGGVTMGIEALKVDEGSLQPVEILEFGSTNETRGSAVQYDSGHYEITVIFAGNGTYAVEAWPTGDGIKSARAEFEVYPRSEPSFLLFGFLGVLVLIFLVVGYAFSRRRG